LQRFAQTVYLDRKSGKRLLKDGVFCYVFVFEKRLGGKVKGEGFDQCENSKQLKKFFVTC